MDDFFDGKDELDFPTEGNHEERGWNTEITDTKEQCHEPLLYRHYLLRCWKSS